MADNCLHSWATLVIEMLATDRISPFVLLFMVLFEWRRGGWGLLRGALVLAIGIPLVWKY